MKGYWIKFEDGSAGYCEGGTAYDAVRIAEHVSGKKAVVGENKWQPDCPTLPYPTNPVIWQFEHPVHGKTPTFCSGGPECMNKGSCPQSYACTN